jgi:hypothetical protein
MLYTNSLYSLLKKKNYNVELIENFDSIKNYENILLILFFFDCKKNVFNEIRKHNIKTFLINTEYYKHFDFDDKIKIINDENLDCTIAEYSVLNLKNIKKEYPKVKIKYLPILYNNYLEEYYISNIEKKIPINEKDIDIFFYGNLNERRLKILKELEKKHNIVYYNGLSNKELLINIERSKIILNIHNHDYNHVFDYYRNAILIANKVFIIYEYPYDIDVEIEPNLKDIKEYLITVDYDKLVETVDYYLENYNKEMVEKQVNKQLYWFKKLSLEDNLNNLI